jgi:hypothetical protein
MTRDEKIQLLVDQDFDYIMANNDSGAELLESILNFGFKGYSDFTDAELDAEIAERSWMNVTL